MARRLVALISRHGETAANKNNQFRSRMDPPLNANGVREAEKLASVVKKKYRVDRITSSPMLRALQTADIVAEAIGAKVSQDRGLISWNLGFLSGRDKDEFKDILEYYVDNPKEAPPEGESLDEFEQRGIEFFEPELKRDPQDVAVGTPQGGYSEEGPFHCKDCVHKPKKDSPYCLHPKIVGDPRLAKQLTKIDGKQVVSIKLETGCCEYVRPEEDKDPPIPMYVTHTSNVIALENFFHGNRDGRPEVGEEAVGPGGLAEIWEKDDGEYELKPVISEQPAEFGE